MQDTDDATYISYVWDQIDQCTVGGEHIPFDPFDFSSTGATTPGLTAGSTASTPSPYESDDEVYGGGDDDGAPLDLDDWDEQPEELGATSGDEGEDQASEPELVSRLEAMQRWPFLTRLNAG